jgi:hypothetical protein
MNIFHAAKALGGVVTGRNNVLCPGPGHSPRDLSLSVRFNGDDFIVFSHAGDDWRACKDHVRHRLDLGDFTSAEGRPVQIFGSRTITPEDSQRTQHAFTLWSEARSIVRTPAEAYLASRGVSYQGEALRWHPSCPFGKGERHGCMIGLVRNIVTDEPQAVHRTAIDANGRKIDRKAYGPMGGGAVKLTDDADVTKVVAIAEGIETALSIRELPDLNAMPVWSLISAGGMSNFPLLKEIETLWIGVDHDSAGIAAARRTALTWFNARREVIIVHPNERGEDLNDVIGRAAHG